MRDKILKTVALLSARYGLKKFTVDEVASELHISKKTLYQYFRSKDEMIQAYFDENIESDKKNVLIVLESNSTFYEKLHTITYSNLRYRLPVSVLDDTKRFYPTEWEKIEDLKQFKLNALQKILRQAEDNGICANCGIFPRERIATESGRNSARIF
jgi:Transcriptional regulator